MTADDRDRLGGLGAEATRFSEKDNVGERALAWNAIPAFRRRIAEHLDVGAAIRTHLAGRRHPRALTLGCGDMAGEYPLLSHAGVAEIDAFDISAGQRDKFYRYVYDGKVLVEYSIADANEVEPLPGRYDVVYLQHAYHHLVALEAVADRIARALVPDGMLAIVDYVGANRLQRTPRQRDLCGAIWRTLPERYRVRPNGKVFAELRIPSEESLAPYEAVRSEDIISVLDARFVRRDRFLYGGILFPLFNGCARNFTDSAEDEEFLRLMWDLDQWLISAGRIEPNFMKAVYSPRQ